MLTPVIAHLGQPGSSVIGQWRPALGLGIVFAVAVYQRGYRGLPPEPTRRRLFLGGAAFLAAALVTPLDALAESLAWAHMVQHMLVLVVAAPLLAASQPMPTLLRAVPLGAQRALWRTLRGFGIERHRSAWVTTPAIVWLAYAGTLWLWHAAGPYQAAVGTDWIHAAEHASFLVVGLAFWHLALGGGRRPMLPGFRVLFMFTAAMQSVLLAALLTFAPTPWYPVYAGSGFDLDPLTDQQLAGLLLWIPSGLVYTGVSVLVTVAWITRDESLPGTVHRSPT